MQRRRIRTGHTRRIVTQIHAAIRTRITVGGDRFTAFAFDDRIFLLLVYFGGYEFEDTVETLTQFLPFLPFATTTYRIRISYLEIIEYERELSIRRNGRE